MTTLTATKEARSMKKKHSGNIFRYGKDLLRSNSYTGRRGPEAGVDVSFFQSIVFETP